MAVGEACPGLLDAAGGEALERVVQSSNLIRDAQQAVGVAAMGKALEGAYRAGPKVRETPVAPCTVTGRVGTNRSAEIWLSADSRHADQPGGMQTGVRESRGEKERGVAFDCVSSRVGSTRDVPLRITAVFKDQWSGSAGDAALAKDYLAVAYSAARAVAKELGCEGGGSLPG
ncbi:hypothetical protein OHS33_13770 [Streptomyces sp. NBC_00536]|uniref:hypothetical protein n=1 Tax=Streptomyces sp. NBC_00536 TaxID=2975769 RepID=UPI002E7FB9F0|nr:hypothetical protein [Streptomyces sp. NBC_00536]WUC79310.1 hypothetical protein OHS33_13770 [Streptomyces sp. NBC_00536]